MVDTPQQWQQGSRLLRLPAELRNRIYEEVLISEKPIYLNTTHVRPHATWRWSLGVLQACQMIRAEAQPVYYSNNSFCFSSLWGATELKEDVALASWLSAVSTRTLYSDHDSEAVLEQRLLRTIVRCCSY